MSASVFLVIVGATALSAVGLISAYLQLAIQACAVAYALGRMNEAGLQERERRPHAVAALSQLVSDMGAALAEDDMPEEERAWVQDQRATVLELLALMERPSPWRRAWEKIRRRGSSLV